MQSSHLMLCLFLLKNIKFFTLTINVVKRKFCYEIFELKCTICLQHISFYLTSDIAINVHI